MSPDEMTADLKCKTCHEDLSRDDLAKHFRYCQICRDDFGYINNGGGVNRRGADQVGRSARNTAALGGAPE
jgi:hypothetical protein